VDVVTQRFSVLSILIVMADTPHVTWITALDYTPLFVFAGIAPVENPALPVGNARTPIESTA
jgi:hypothetical protein